MAQTIDDAKKDNAAKSERIADLLAQIAALSATKKAPLRQR